MNIKTLCAPRTGLTTDPREAPKAVAQESMFWEIVPVDVFEVPGELIGAGYECEWRVKKDKMENARGGTWTKFDWSPRPLQLREYARREFWEIFVDERPFCRHSCCKHANVQPRAVFSYAMTVIDKVEGWNEEKWVGSKFAACMWIYTKRVLTGGKNPLRKWRST